MNSNLLSHWLALGLDGVHSLFTDTCYGSEDQTRGKNELVRMGCFLARAGVCNSLSLILTLPRFISFFN